MKRGESQPSDALRREALQTETVGLETPTEISVCCSQRPVRISVCICTYKRAELLAVLLTSLENQADDAQFTFDVIVVDNDHLGSAEKVVQECRNRSSIDVTYSIEPEQNIALARNKAILHSSGDYVAFIDDDEVPSRSWLTNLYATLNKLRVEGVLGPVLPSYVGSPPKWVVKGKFYERPCHKTGQVLHWGNTRTGNALLRRDIFSNQENMFRPQFGSGGEDRDFFRRMIAKGMRFAWCAEASVYEAVPAERCTRSFMLRRALLRGQLPQFSRVAYLKSFFAIPLYTVALPVLFVGGHHIFMKYLIKDCDHIGRICSFLGIRLIKDKYVIQ